MVKPLKTKQKRKNGRQSSLSLRLLGAARKLFFISLPYIFSLSFMAILFGGVVVYAMNTPTFQLQEVKILNGGSMTPQQAFEFAELQRGEGLISLDLVNVQQVIKRKHPEYKEVVVHRVLPNRIEVMLKRRTPAAQLVYSRFIQVDKDMVILPGSSTVAFKNLTAIEGARIPKDGLYVGVTVDDENAKKALKLSEIIKNSNILKDHVLTKIDIADPKNISLIVDTDIEIRIGNNHLIERLKILDQTLKNIALDRAKIRYIDLRFDDVVIGPR